MKKFRNNRQVWCSETIEQLRHLWSLGHGRDEVSRILGFVDPIQVNAAVSRYGITRGNDNIKVHCPSGRVM